MFRIISGSCQVTITPDFLTTAGDSIFDIEKYLLLVPDSKDARSYQEIYEWEALI